MTRAPTVIGGGLRGAIWACLLHLLLLTVVVLIVYGAGLRTPRHGFIGESATDFLVLGTLVLCIPEFVCGFVFGAIATAFSKGNQWATILAGAMVWSAFPML